MDKKLWLSIMYVVLLSLLIGGGILFSKTSDKRRDASISINNVKNNTVIDVNERESTSEYSKNESINVFNNSADIDLHANLVEDKSGQVSLYLTYKINGKIMTKKIDTSSISEIRNIFRFREQQGKGYRINNIILNEDMDKLYFSVEGKKEKGYTQTTVYSYELNNSKTKKIIYELGLFSKFSVSPDGKYTAFSYLSCPQNIANNERSIVVIVRCSDDKIVLNSNEDMIGKYEWKSSDMYIYSYSFNKWHDKNICELSQSIKAKDNSENIIKQRIYYNIID